MEEGGGRREEGGRRECIFCMVATKLNVVTTQVLELQY